MARNIQMHQIQPQTCQASKLKVEDALSYLDRVKQQFCSQPQVYNEFLDIMKEFKSQTIDTPGVISRVSSLFQGHKDLIVGFNTFLPVGYKIELNKATDTINIYQPGNKGMMSTGMSLQSFESMHKRSSRPHGSSQGDQQVFSSPNEHLSPSHEPGGSGQPVEFNHAINYVNKIKNRYQSQPDIYKSFLEILHDYQKQQKQSKEHSSADNKIMEREVYKRVASLFKDEPDLLQEFAQFLPDARASPPDNGLFWGQQGNGSNLLTLCSSTMPKKQAQMNNTSAASTLTQTSLTAPHSGSSCSGGGGGANPSNVASTSNISSGNGLHSSAVVGKRKRLSSTASHSGHPSVRRFKQDSHSPTSKEALAEISKYGSLGDFAFFDKVRSSLGESMYQDFLKCLMLFNTREMRMTGSELMQMIHPFCLKMPELKKRMKQLLNQKEESVDSTMSTYGRERISGGEYVGEIDYASCKRYDVSYLALPKDHLQPKCSGRTVLCQEVMMMIPICACDDATPIIFQVLNDTYVSFPSWSEDSSSVIKKTTAEEMMFRCEEDRYQLDIVLDNMMSTMELFRFLKEKMESMTTEEKSKFKLEESLGGRSEVLHKKAIKGLYGDSAGTIVDHLMNHPYEAVPLVLKRLEVKVNEWKEAKARNSKIWNEQNQKYYLKSLDHAGINFKQSDSKHFRSKPLLQEIEAAYEKSDKNTSHLDLDYTNREPFVSDACSLVIHHVKRQANMHQDEKHKMKQLLKHFLPDFLFTNREPLSDDENNDDDEKFEKPCFVVASSDADERMQRINSSSETSVFFVNSNWYIFIRLHFFLCDRLRQFHAHAQRMMEERLNDKNLSSSTAMSLGLRGPPPDPTQSYPALLKMIKSCLDGHVEAASFEEQLREVFTTNAYVAFTIDKLIQNIVRQLQHLSTDEICIRLVDLYNKECLSKPLFQHTCVVAELAYQRKAERLLVGENCFKMTFNKKQGILSFELIPPNTSHVNSPSSNERWMKEVENVIEGGEEGGAEQTNEIRSRRLRHSAKSMSVGAPILLKRNMLRVNRTRMVVDPNQMEVLGEKYGVTFLSGDFPDETLVISLKRFKRKYVPSNGSMFKAWRIDPFDNCRVLKKSEQIRKSRKEKMQGWMGKYPIV